MATVPPRLGSVVATALSDLSSTNIVKSLPLLAGLVGVALLALRVPGAIAKGNLSHPFCWCLNPHIADD